MKRPPLPRVYISQAWIGLPRQCPKCENVFTTKRYRSRCPKCKTIFFAIDVHGPPPSIDLETLAEVAATVSPETSMKFMKRLTERANVLPKRPPTFDDPRLKDALASEQERWEWDNYLMQEALNNGGELWRWSTSPESWEAMMGACGFAVVKDGHVIAVTQTAMN